MAARPGANGVACGVGHWYIGTMQARRKAAGAPGPVVERVQTGVRLEKRLLKVLKGLAEQRDLSLGDLLEVEGVKAGDRVVLAPPEKLRDGATVALLKK